MSDARGVFREHRIKTVNGKSRAIDVITFQPGLEDRRYAEEHGVDWQRIIEDIHDWAENAPPAKRKKKNPHSFWKMWVRREADRKPRRQDNLKFDHL